MPHYQPIGTVYQVKFQDELNFSWDQNVVVTYEAGVEAVLKVLDLACPGKRVTEIVKLVDVHHGQIDQQVYTTQAIPPKRRTMWEVIAARRTPVGCCNRNADNMACDCLTETE